MVREYGYREYPDHLTPGKGGLSSLLFDNGDLSGHAPFYALAVDDDQTDSSDDDSSDIDPAVVALVVGGAVAVGYGLAKVTGHVIRSVRTRRSRPEASDGSTDEANARSVAAANDGAQAVEVDDDDALIEEVNSLIKETGSTMKEYDERRYSGDDDRQHSGDGGQPESTTTTERARRVISS